MDNNIIIGRGVAAGTNAYTVTLSVAVNELLDGNIMYITFTNGNSTAVTLNTNGIGVISVTNQFGEALTGGEIPAGSTLQLMYLLAGDELRIISNASTSTLQAVHNVIKTDIQTVTTVKTDWTDIVGLEITIIPSKASDKFLIEGYLNSGSASTSTYIRIVRIVDPLGSPVLTPIGIGDAAGIRIQVTAVGLPTGIADMANTSWSIEDLPNTTENILYKVQASRSSTANNIFINRGSDNTDTDARGRASSGLTVWHFN